MVTSVVGIVICRVGAVLLFVQGVKSLQFVLPALLQFRGDFSPSIYFLLFTTVTPAVGGLALWFFAERICRVNIGSADVEIRSSLNAFDLVGIGTLLIGLYAVFYGVTEALLSEATILTQVAEYKDRPETLGEISAKHISMRVAYVSQIVLGTLLILGRQQIARLLMSARYPKPKSTDR